jgi:hypothetical protein
MHLEDQEHLLPLGDRTRVLDEVYGTPNLKFARTQACHRYAQAKSVEPFYRDEILRWQCDADQPRITRGCHTFLGRRCGRLGRLPTAALGGAVNGERLTINVEDPSVRPESSTGQEFLVGDESAGPTIWHVLTGVTDSECVREAPHRSLVDS